MKFALILCFMFLGFSSIIAQQQTNTKKNTRMQITTTVTPKPDLKEEVSRLEALVESAKENPDLSYKELEKLKNAKSN